MDKKNLLEIIITINLLIFWILIIISVISLFLKIDFRNSVVAAAVIYSSNFLFRKQLELERK